MRSKPAVAALRNEGFNIQTIDARQNRDLFQKYNIRYVPTYVYVVDGKEVRRSSGLESASEIRWMFLPPLF